MEKLKGYLLVALGWFCLGLAAVGILFPILPTTPFVILAAFLFSKGSPRLHAWLHRNRLFGPILYDWETHGSISLRIKWISTMMMAVFISYPVFFLAIPIVAKIAMIMVAAGVSVFIWTRPSVKAPALIRKAIRERI